MDVSSMQELAEAADGFLYAGNGCDMFISSACSNHNHYAVCSKCHCCHAVREKLSWNRRSGRGFASIGRCVVCGYTDLHMDNYWGTLLYLEHQDREEKVNGPCFYGRDRARHGLSMSNVSGVV
jgi:hypothetical protein